MKVRMCVGGIGQWPGGHTAGFIFDPEGRREVFSYRRARNYRQAVGQVAWTFPQSPSGRSQNENRSRTSARARRGVVSANEKKEKRKKRKYSGAPEKLGKIVDWSKIILINFSPITNFFRLRFSSFPFPLSPTTRTKSPSVMQITPDSGREKKAIDAQ